MDTDRTAAPARPPSQNDGRIRWPFGGGFPSSDPQQDAPLGGVRCADHDGRTGLTRLDTVDREAMQTASPETSPPTGPIRSAHLPAAPGAEPPVVLVDHDAGRVLLRDRGETVGYELRLRRGRRGSALGWVELVLAEEGSVVETAVSAAEVMAIASDAGREAEVAELSRRVALAFLRQDDPVCARVGDRLLAEVRDGRELERVSLRALQARMLERLAAGETLVTMCERAGFIDRDGRIDTTWLQRRAGLLPDRCSRTGKVRRARTAGYEVFLRLVRAVDGTPEEFGV
jgi:hypothetical protein